MAKKVSKRMHASKCGICSHTQLADIEIDYLHCIPWSKICERYKVTDQQIQNHAIAMDLIKQRNRKSFYWRFIEKFDFSKMTGENALEAAKQLDKLEHKIDKAYTPTNIQVIYSSGIMGKVEEKKIPEKIEERITENVPEPK